MPKNIFELAESILQKEAMTPTEQMAPPAPPAGPAAAGPPPPPAAAGGAMPMDPAMGGGMPMDPAMAGAMPMDPAMGGGMPMDPAMAGGPMPEGEDPLEMLIERLDGITEMMVRVDRRSDQTAKILAVLAEQLQINVPATDIMDAGDPPPQLAKKSGESMQLNDAQDGYAADLRDEDLMLSYESPAKKLDAITSVAQRMFG